MRRAEELTDPNLIIFNIKKNTSQPANLHYKNLYKKKAFR